MHHLLLTVLLTIPAIHSMDDDTYNLIWILISVGVLVGCVALAVIFNKKVSHEHEYTWIEISQCTYSGLCKCGAKTTETRHSWGSEKEVDIIDDGGWRSTKVKYITCQRCGKSKDSN